MQRKKTNHEVWNLGRHFSESKLLSQNREKTIWNHPKTFTEPYLSLFSQNVSGIDGRREALSWWTSCGVLPLTSAGPGFHHKGDSVAWGSLERTFPLHLGDGEGHGTTAALRVFHWWGWCVAEGFPWGRAAAVAALSPRHPGSTLAAAADLNSLVMTGRGEGALTRGRDCSRWRDALGGGCLLHLGGWTQRRCLLTASRRVGEHPPEGPALPGPAFPSRRAWTQQPTDLRLWG